MKIVLIHGFNVRDGGAKTIDRLKPFLEKAGHEVDIDTADYGYYSLWKVRFRKHSAVRRIAEALKTADAVISHSNGSNYENKALGVLELRDRKYLSVRLSPALNRKASVPKSVKKCYVFYTRTDFWVWLSGFLVFHSWGRQGQLGYRGTPDSRVLNCDYTDCVQGHSDWFSERNVEFIAKEIINTLENTP